MFLTSGCLDNIQMFSIHVKLEFRYFTLESILSWCIYSKTKQNKALYIFSDRLYSQPFSFNCGEPRYYLDFFLIRVKLEFWYFTSESKLSFCIDSKTEQNKGLYIFFNRLYSEPFFFYLWGFQILFRFFLIHVKLEFRYFT